MSVLIIKFELAVTLSFHRDFNILKINQLKLLSNKKNVSKKKFANYEYP